MSDTIETTHESLEKAMERAVYDARIQALADVVLALQELDNSGLPLVQAGIDRCLNRVLDLAKESPNAPR